MTELSEKLTNLNSLVDTFIEEYDKLGNDNDKLGANINGFVAQLSNVGGAEITEWKEKKKREGKRPSFEDILELQGLIQKRMSGIVDENNKIEKKMKTMYDELIAVVGSSEPVKVLPVEPVKSNIEASVESVKVPLKPVIEEPVKPVKVASVQPDTETSVEPEKVLLKADSPDTGLTELEKLNKLEQQYEAEKAERERKFKEGTGGRKTLRKRIGKKKRKSYKLANRKHSAASSSL